jgi:endonuclease YncB( thermonuclease family)
LRRRSSSRKRPLPRTLADAAVFLVLLSMLLLAARQGGWLSPESGQFTAVDGDSLRKGESEYRLHAIDAPELHQVCQNGSGRDYHCGREAQGALRRLVTGKPLDCLIHETDRYGRLVASCSAGDTDINNEMVRLGWALAYRRHGLGHIAAEAEARKARRGIWQGRFENPEDWRAAHRDGLVRGGMTEDAAPD